MKKVQHWLPAWESRASALEKQYNSALREIQVRYAVPKEERAALFETRAKQKEAEVKSTLREDAHSEDVPWWIEFVQADPDGKKLSKAPLDRSSILATPDVLLNDPVGLQPFLVLGKAPRGSTANRNPSQMPGPGPDTDPAVMSMGRAVKMFGQLSLEPEPEKESDASDQAPPQPTTELEKRGSTVVADDSPEDQWALFYGQGGFLADSSRLARQYKKLVALNLHKLAADKAAAAEKAKAKAQAKAQAKKDAGPDAPSPTPSPPPSPAPVLPAWTPSDGCWPPFAETELEWNGFVNWASRCKRVDATFQNTLIKWTGERNTHKKAVRKALANWTPSDEFTRRTGFEPNPAAHYHAKDPMWVVDGRKHGWNIGPSKK